MGPRHPYFKKTRPCNFDKLSELRTRVSELLSSAFRTSESLTRCSAVVRYVIFLPPDPFCYIWPSPKLPNLLPKIIPLLKLALSTEQIKFKVFNIMLKILAIFNDWWLVHFPAFSLSNSYTLLNGEPTSTWGSGLPMMRSLQVRCG